MRTIQGNTNNNSNGGEEKETISTSPISPKFDFDFPNELNHINSVMNSNNNNNNPPPQVQPATAAANSIHWDVEEDHLLSYFLGANDGAQNNNNGTNIPASDIAVEQQQQPAVNIEPTSILRSSSQPNNHYVLAARNSSLENFVNTRARQSSDGLTSIASSSSMNNNNPPTHSVHFSDQVRPPLPAAVGNMSSQGSFQGSIQGSMPRIPSRASSEGSSSSSLASMAAALALGVSPNQVMYMQQKLQNRDQLSGIQHQLSNTSPITPVNMMGSPNEHMMLPPPPRYPNGHPRNNLGYQQYMMQAQQQQQPHPQMVPSMNPQTVNNATQQPQKPNFLPQMNPTNQQPQQQNHMNMGFPDPNSVTSSILAQPQSHPMQQQQQPFQQQQIQIGLNGQTIPITAVPSANGQVTYQIDPSVVPTAGLRYFTKAINEVSKPEEEKDVDPKEAAEKRRQRLARNRESARNSRRRKKELLQTLSVKVKKLQGEVETEVRAKIGSMEVGLVQQRKEMIEQLLAEQEKNQEGDEQSRNQLKVVLQKTGVNCQIRRAVIAHQYNILRQTFLSPHNHFTIWMMLKSATFFTEASRRHQAKIASGDVKAPANKTPSTRANSKQIGEDIYNEQKKRQGSVSCNANDELQMWPLYCYEITMTMEQEDRIINQAHAMAKNTPHLQTKLEKIKVATDATRHLQNAMQCHTQLASQRNETLLLDILTPAQAVLFKGWFETNKERCRSLMDRGLQSGKGQGVASSAGISPENGKCESTLGGVCKQLEDMGMKE